MWDRFDLAASISDNVDRLRTAKILIVGAGSLGSDLAIRLAGCRIGQLVLVDGDTVSEHNVPHSPVFTINDIGKLKCEVLAKALAVRFPNLQTITHPVFIQQADSSIFDDVDFVVCAPDNDQTRIWVNHHAVRRNKPCVFIGISGQSKGQEWKGYTLLVRPGETACFLCFATGGDQIESFDPGQIDKSEQIETARKKCGGENVAVPLLSPVVAHASSIASSIVMLELLGQRREETYVYFDLWSMKLNAVAIARADVCVACTPPLEHSLDSLQLTNI